MESMFAIGSIFRFSRAQLGFTLAEISIVLVVVGLLIGGVLVGQSLVDSARVSKQAKQFQQFDIAIGGFKEKYKQLPGDTTFLRDPNNTAITPGNNDGIITDRLTPGLRWHDGSEIANVWYQLTVNEALGGKKYLTSYNGSEICAGVYSPEAALKGTGNRRLVFMVYGISSTGKNYYGMFRSCASNNWDADFTPYVKAIDLANLDIKIDDGNGISGKIVARTNAHPVTLEDDSTAPAGNCINALGVYNVGSSSDQQCTPRIEMFSTR
jgi:prepilin-type N-terminal cleavage/methylation domain-containing protein